MIMIKKIWNTKGKQEGENLLSLRQNKEQEGVWDCIITKQWHTPTLNDVEICLIYVSPFNLILSTWES